VGVWATAQVRANPDILYSVRSVQCFTVFAQKDNLVSHLVSYDKLSHHQGERMLHSAITPLLAQAYGAVHCVLLYQQRQNINCW
jgi:hypothetical protein